MFGMIIAWHLCLPSTMAELLRRSPVRCLKMKIATQKRKNHQERADSTCKMWDLTSKNGDFSVSTCGLELRVAVLHLQKTSVSFPNRSELSQFHCNIFRKMLTDRHLGHLATMVRSLQKGSPKEPEIWWNLFSLIASIAVSAHPHTCILVLGYPHGPAWFDPSTFLSWPKRNPSICPSPVRLSPLYHAICPFHGDQIPFSKVHPFHGIDTHTHIYIYQQFSACLKVVSLCICVTWYSAHPYHWA